jgi:hypothetical protein
MQEGIVHTKQESTHRRQDLLLAGPDQQRGNQDSLAFLKALTEASAVFLAYTFIGGWSYLAAYYSAFGLNPLELDVSTAVVCTTAIYVLYDATWPLIVVAALVLGWGLLAPRFQRLSRSLGVAALGLLLLTVATAGVAQGRRRAAEDAVTDSSTLPFVAFTSRFPKTDQPPCVDYQTYGSFDCKLLLHSRKTYFFFEPIPDVGEGSLNVFTLSDSDVEGAHILRGLDRNARVK